MSWEASPTLTQNEYGAVFAMITVKLGLTQSRGGRGADNRVVFSKALH
jgi:hypothetical protein